MNVSLDFQQLGEIKLNCHSLCCMLCTVLTSFTCRVSAIWFHWHNVIDSCVAIVLLHLYILELHGTLLILVCSLYWSSNVHFSRSSNVIQRHNKHMTIITAPCLRKKNKQNYYCYNYVKLPSNLTIFSTKMANSLKLYEVHSFSTSPNSHQCTTLLNADIPYCYITL